MRVVFGEAARADLDERVAVSIQEFEIATTAVTFERLNAHIEFVIANHPRTGRYNRNGDYWEAWVPRAPFIVIYRFNESVAQLTVVAIFHHAQDRSKYKPTSDK